jgi:hypothetical protein
MPVENVPQNAEIHRAVSFAIPAGQIREIGKASPHLQPGRLREEIAQSNDGFDTANGPVPGITQTGGGS